MNTSNNIEQLTKIKLSYPYPHVLGVLLCSLGILKFFSQRSQKIKNDITSTLTAAFSLSIRKYAFVIIVCWLCEFLITFP